MKHYYTVDELEELMHIQHKRYTKFLIFFMAISSLMGYFCGFITGLILKSN